MRTTRFSIEGFVNPNGYYPSFLNIIARSAGKYFAVLPDTKILEVPDFEERKRKLLNFIPCKEKTEVIKGQYAFGISPEKVFVDTPHNIYKRLTKMSSLLNKRELEIVLRYLEANKDDERITWSCLFEAIKHNTRIRVIVSHRKLKRKNMWANRLILQFLKGSNFVTFYRKNFNQEQTIETTAISKENIFFPQYKYALNDVMVS